ncbi:hypothetical protein MKW98_021791, partial [Papaver atlanticum]
NKQLEVTLKIRSKKQAPRVLLASTTSTYQLDRGAVNIVVMMSQMDGGCPDNEGYQLFSKQDQMKMIQRVIKSGHESKRQNYVSSRTQNNQESGNVRLSAYFYPYPL